MALRKFLCKLLTRKQVCECFEESSKDMLSANSKISKTNRSKDNVKVHAGLKLKLFL